MAYLGLLAMNRLYYGDNLHIMQNKMLHEQVDLIYLDPPFNSARYYNMIYTDITGNPIPEQALAFADTWEMSAEQETMARKMPVLMQEYGVDELYIEIWRIWMNALRKTYSPLLAYLLYMVERLLIMKWILKPTGSIYLHCDPTASHYIKIMMDGIFGQDNFRNEIIWERTKAKGDAQRKFAWNHDVLLAYSFGNKYTFNPVFAAKTEEYESRFGLDDNDGRGPYHSAPLDSPSIRPNLTYEYKGYKPPAKGWRVSLEEMKRLDADDRLIFPKDKNGRIRRKLYASEQLGPKVGDVWTDIAPLQASRGSGTKSERFDYPTQKPIALLKRIIEASSNEGDTVFDPFCGCGTTIYAAHLTKRNWIGCDIAMPAIQIVQDALRDRYFLEKDKHYMVDGIPITVEQAEVLFNASPTSFQNWIVEAVKGVPSTKKSGDGGIDGRIWFFDENKDMQCMVLSVKGGHIKPADIRDLRGVLEREDSAHMAGFLSLNEPTKAMKQEAAQAGIYECDGESYQRMQLLTAQQILEEGKTFMMPKRVRIGSKAASKQHTLFGS